MRTLDFAIGPEPTWIACSRCGQQSTRNLCHQCHDDDAAAELEKERKAQSGFPKRFDWCLSGVLNAERIQLPTSVDGEPCKSLNGAAARIKRRPNAILSGPSGCGKTSLAITLASQRPWAMFVRAEKLARARAEASLGNEAPLVVRCSNVPLLVLDDLGSDEVTKTSAVRDVIFERHDNALATWVTTGLNAWELERLYGEGILRRLVANATIVKWASK